MAMNPDCPMAILCGLCSRRVCCDCPKPCDQGKAILEKEYSQVYKVVCDFK